MVDDILSGKFDEEADVGVSEDLLADEFADT